MVAIQKELVSLASKQTKLNWVRIDDGVDDDDVDDVDDDEEGEEGEEEEE